MDDLNAPQPSGAELVKKLRKPTKKAKKAAKRVVKKASGAIAERLDLRLPKSVKAKLTAKAKKTRRTITSIMLELLEKAK